MTSHSPRWSHSFHDDLYSCNGLMEHVTEAYRVCGGSRSSEFTGWKAG